MLTFVPDVESYKMLPSELIKERGQQIWEKYFVLESDFFLDQEEVEDPKVNFQK